MVHNGIEYGDMQLIAEIYDLLHRGLGLTAGELHEILLDGKVRQGITPQLLGGFAAGFHTPPAVHILMQFVQERDQSLVMPVDFRDAGGEFLGPDNELRHDSPCVCRFWFLLHDVFSTAF
jgi:hypothetical protein